MRRSPTSYATPHCGMKVVSQTFLLRFTYARYQPRARQPGRLGRSRPIVVSSP